MVNLNQSDWGRGGVLGRDSYEGLYANGAEHFLFCLFYRKCAMVLVKSKQLLLQVHITKIQCAVGVKICKA